MTLTSSYYDILDVDKAASSTEIKKAYRMKSLHYHPDRNDALDAEERMSEINEAYEILSDPVKKKHYDIEQRLKDTPFGFPFMQVPTQTVDEQDIQELFTSLFGGTTQMFQDRDIPMEELFSRNPFHKKNKKPDPITMTLHISLEQAYNGCSLPIEIIRWSMVGDDKIQEEETVYVDVYEGIDNNEIIVLEKMGNVTEQQVRGDVKITIQIDNETHFQRQGLDLIYTKTLTLKEALCGFSFELLHFDSKKLQCNNNSQVTMVKPDTRKVIPKLGMKRSGNRGNLIIAFKVEFPDKLAPHQIEQMQLLL